jgi:hypothetical protein
MPAHLTGIDAGSAIGVSAREGRAGVEVDRRRADGLLASPSDASTIESMDLTLQRPEGLDDANWRSIEDCVGRLQRASLSPDWPLMIGSAKELAEALARIVLEARGETVESKAELPRLLTRAHLVLDRQPGVGLASDSPVREVAQGLKTMIAQLPELRNRYGTGHGRAVSPDVVEEIASVTVEAAMLWCRWALRRLQHLIAGSPSGLVRDLREGAIFTRGLLRQRLIAANLSGMEPADQRLVGLAVAQRSMSGTFTVQEDGVEACAAAPDLRAWPAPYREGVVDGLFLDRSGYLDVNEWGARHAAAILAVHPDPVGVLTSLKVKIESAGWAYRFINDAEGRGSVLSEMRAATAILPQGDGQAVWNEIAERIGGPVTTGQTS